VNAPVDFPAQQAGGLQNAQVFGDGGQRNVERRGQLADCRLALGQPAKDGAARGIGERAKGGVEGICASRSGLRRRIVNHMV
jgi:hypothetical protein